MRKIGHATLSVLLAVVLADNIAVIKHVPCAFPEVEETRIDSENMWNNVAGTHLTDEDPEACENVWMNGMRYSRPQMETGRPYRALFLGCSYTFGLGLNDDKTYVWRLNELMPEVEFDNGAVGGYGALQSLIRLRRLMKFKRYDCVIYGAIELHLRRSSCPQFRIDGTWENTGDLNDRCRDLYCLPYTELTSKFEFIDHKLHRYYFPGATFSPLCNLIAQYYGVHDVLHKYQPDVHEQRLIFASHMNRMAQVAAAYGSKFLLVSLDGAPAFDDASLYSPMVKYFNNRFYKDIEAQDRVRHMEVNHPGAEVNDYWARKLAHFLSQPENFASLIQHADNDGQNHRTLYDLERQEVSWPW